MSDIHTLLSPKRLAVGFGVITVLLLVIAASTSTTAFGIYNAAWDGSSELREVADTTGASSTIAHETTQYTQVPPNGTVAIILSPDQAYTAAERKRIRTFVRRGGTLVVADDYGSHTNELLSGIGAKARIDGRPLRDPQSKYKSPALPVAHNTSNSSIVTGVSGLTLNHGTAVNPHNATVLVRTSDYAYLDTNRNASFDDAETTAAYPVATTERIGRGRILVVGDPSVFINTMLDRPGNRAFARNLFARHTRVMLDYSHTASLPPLAVALIIIRGSPLIQFLGGLLGTVAIALGMRSNAGTAVKATISSSPRRDSTVEVDDAALAQYLHNHHPEWDDDRIQRVVTARRTTDHIPKTDDTDAELHD